MNREDFLRLAGGDKDNSKEYIPIACMLCSGYGCVGYFNSSVNDGFDDTIVLLNARLVDLRGEDGHSRRGKVADFNDFLEDVVADHYSRKSKGNDDESNEGEKTIPLAAIPLSEISLLYPVARMGEMLKRLQKSLPAESKTSGDDESLPSFLDFNNKSIVLKALRTKLW